MSSSEWRIRQLCCFLIFSCSKCTVCIYCDNECRHSSWVQIHQWECRGMQTKLWYDVGIAFPAWRAVVKGVDSGYAELKEQLKSDVHQYGDFKDNYSYFNRLESNLSRVTDIKPYVVVRKYQCLC